MSAAFLPTSPLHLNSPFHCRCRFRLSSTKNKIKSSTRDVLKLFQYIHSIVRAREEVLESRIETTRHSLSTPRRQQRQTVAKPCARVRESIIYFFEMNWDLNRTLFSDPLDGLIFPPASIITRLLRMKRHRRP
jgi:hypothetical protein